MFSDLREGKYIHATPTLFNAGLVNHQMASCFLLGNEDSIHVVNSLKEMINSCFKSTSSTSKATPTDVLSRKDAL